MTKALELVHLKRTDIEELTVLAVINSVRRPADLGGRADMLFNANQTRGLHGHGSLKQRGLDLLPATGPFTDPEGQHDAVRHQHRDRAVGDPNARSDGDSIVPAAV